MTNLLVFVWLHLQLVFAGSVIWLFVYDACNFVPHLLICFYKYFWCVDLCS